MAEEIKIQITADGAAARSEIDQTAAAIRTAGSAGQSAAAGIQSTTAGIRSLTSVMRGAMGLFGVMGVVGGVMALVSNLRAAYDWYQKLVGVNKELATEAHRAARAADAFHTSVAGLNAIRDAASRAGVSADTLSEKLRAYGAHKIGFAELASSISLTTAELRALQRQAERDYAGTTYLAQIGAATEAKAAAAKKTKLERHGLRAATEAIRRGGPEEEAGWDVLLDAAGGDVEKAGELYNKNKSFLNMHTVGTLMFGHTQLPAARQRWEERQATQTRGETMQDTLAYFDIVAQNVVTLGGKIFDGLLDKMKAAEDYVAEQDAYARASHDAEIAMLQRQQEADIEERAERRKAIAQAETTRTGKISAITVDAPRAASQAASIGGITGGMRADNAARLADQRAAALEAIQREHTRLLNDIKERLGE